MDGKSSIVLQSPHTAHLAHSHFYQYYEEFHGLPKGESNEDTHSKIQEKLRNQYLNDQDVESKLCYRNCFKLNEKKYVEFCLDRKCGGIAYLKAANYLGLVKSAHHEKKHKEGHSHHH